VHLTSLSLQGFKSFADRTTISFAPGITAIVGPNGSGKSNIIDALRWTTGGGRASEFRADDKGELIFHGAAGRRAVSYAEVELELRSATALVVTRQLFRDGQTKLRLNGRPARLLDIEEALSGSGLGRGGLALIGQGEVSQVLMATPERLLGYVAEAAGVTRLSSRREQAQLRLETTREHLARLSDIAHEQAQQLAHLEAEAAQAARASALDRELLQLRYTLSLRRVMDVKDEVVQLRRAIAQAQETLAHERQHVRVAQEAWHALRSKLEREEVAYRQLMAEVEAKRGDQRVAEAQRQHLFVRRDDLERQHQAFARDLAQLISLARPPVPEVDLDALAAEERRLNEALADAMQRVAKLEGERGERETELQKARQRWQHYQQAVASFASRQQELQSQLDEARRSLRREDEPAYALKPLEERLRACQHRLQESEVALQRARKTLEQRHSAHAQCSAQAAALERSLQQRRAALTARRGYAQGPRLALTSGIDGVIGSVADLIRVPDRYAAALSSALGRRLENVIVEQAEVAEALVGHLKARGGWATMIALDLVSPRRRSPAAIRREEGVVGYADELVEVEPRYQPLTQELLGTTLVVSDLSRAVALARRYRQRPRLVTLEGDVLEPFGAISGGKRQLPSDLLGAAQEVQALEREAKEAREAERREHKRLNEAQADVTECHHSVAALAAELKELETQLARAREAQLARDARRSALEQQIVALEERLRSLEAPAEPERDDAQLEAALQTVTEVLAAARHEASTLRDALAQTHKRLAVAQEQVRHHRQALAQYEAALGRREEAKRRLAEVTIARRTLEREIAKAEEAVHQAKAALPTDLDEKTAVYEALKKAVADAEAAFALQTQRQAEAGAKLEQLELTLARREAALEHAESDLASFPDGLSPLEGASRSLRERLAAAEAERNAIGPVNHRAQLEREASEQRYRELQAQLSETEAAAGELERVLDELDNEVTRRLTAALTQLKTSFAAHVAQLFGPGARADVHAQFEGRRPVGLQIELTPPGKATRSLSLLSVGERTMGALAFLFALMSEGRGLPIAILDEVDAPLDEANIRRFTRFLARLAAQGTQFILITHQKATMEVADTLWGVTTEQGVSRVFSMSRGQEVAV
jgi:chromosome segregation protein